MGFGIPLVPPKPKIVVAVEPVVPRVKKVRADPDSKAPDYDADPTLRVVWVFENLGRKVVDYDHAPGSGAIGWLEFLKKDDKARADFYRTAPLKMMPAKTQTNAGTGAADDSRTILECISAARSASAASVPKPTAEGPDRESGIPGDVAAGGEPKP